MKLEKRAGYVLSHVKVLLCLSFWFDLCKVLRCKLSSASLNPQLQTLQSKPLYASYKFCPFFVHLRNALLVKVPQKNFRYSTLYQHLFYC